MLWRFLELAVVTPAAWRQAVGVVVEIEIFTTFQADVSALSGFFATFVWHT